MFQDNGLSDEEVSAEFLDNVPFLVSTEDNYDLMKPFSEKEILEMADHLLIDCVFSKKMWELVLLGSIALFLFKIL